jgi:hypothetical protein
MPRRRNLFWQTKDALRGYFNNYVASLVCHTHNLISFTIIVKMIPECIALTIDHFDLIAPRPQFRDPVRVFQDMHPGREVPVRAVANAERFQDPLAL